jgi:hypothetical protein
LYGFSLTLAFLQVVSESIGGIEFMIIEYAPKNTPYYGGMSMDIITPCWTITDNKKPAKPYGLRVFKLIRILLNLYLVEAGSTEPRTEYHN